MKTIKINKIADNEIALDGKVIGADTDAEVMDVLRNENEVIVYDSLKEFVEYLQPNSVPDKNIKCKPNNSGDKCYIIETIDVTNYDLFVYGGEVEIDNGIYQLIEVSEEIAFVPYNDINYAHSIEPVVFYRVKALTPDAITIYKKIFNSIHEAKEFINQLETEN